MPPSFLFGVRTPLARVALPSRKTATGQRSSICQSGVASIGGCDSASLVRMKFLTISPVKSSTWTTQNPLRLMPLGGSITHGVGSSHQYGYRKIMLDLLRDDGFHILMVGSRKAGTKSNNNHEGWRGFRIDQIERRAVPSRQSCVQCSLPSPHGCLAGELVIAPLYDHSLVTRSRDAWVSG
ncbi:hypothetical protein B0T11DRAFT_273063 [Plectosphaerella cucumerina]|uniref:Uncharacterized protein n=1 Tax=Plectosphaerella cucumerina TaxID=40658 RepID=A0A8K0TSW5_9PEZI|nr:hypothetical protein B0T11DRAFT_273063 [Plectosphaerella cucumerina]